MSLVSSHSTKHYYLYSLMLHLCECVLNAQVVVAEILA